ncbi:hypothetical protein E2C01_073157 [Portunus trituberculatus]|uniref:Uncharacterized protein n=1 Tax=Portunus trituberculatus TaxID=210409 RepID=A0A5B7I8P4_PORTR|nr:hypothetical protein [Portunus trituberculatus]
MMKWRSILPSHLQTCHHHHQQSQPPQPLPLLCRPPSLCQ